MKKLINSRKNFNYLCLLLGLLGMNFNNLNAQTVIEVGTQYNFVQEPSSTVDYEITLTAPGEITLHIDSWQSTLNWGLDIDRIYIYNSDNIPLMGNVFATEEDPFLFHMFQGNEGLTFNVGQADTYTISVHSGENWDWGSTTIQEYDLQVTALYCDDTYEPNDTLATASTIAVGNTITAYQWRQSNTEEIQGDEDWYILPITSPGVLRIELVDWVAIYNWSANFDRLFVYNEDGESIGFSGGENFYAWMMGGGTDLEPVVIEMNLAHAGNYYFRFYSGIATSTTPYHFTTTFTPVDDTFEPNDDFATAKLIPAADVWYQAYEWRSLDNTMNVVDDEDYYYFHAASAGEYSLTLDGWIPILNWGTNYDRLFIYDEFENPVGASPYSWMMGASPIVLNLPEAGKYYLQLHCGNGVSTTGYQFKITGLLNTSIEDANNNEQLFKIYPNPVTDFISWTIELENKVELKLNIYNMQGQIVRSEILKQDQKQINVSELPHGFYTLELLTGESSRKQKFIVTK